MTEKNKELRDKLMAIETLIVNSLRVQPHEDDECEVHLKLTMAKVAELSAEYLGMNCVEAYDIDWDTDGKDPKSLGLPPSMRMCVAQCDIPNLSEEIADMLSDRSGWCVNSCRYRVL